MEAATTKTTKRNIQSPVKTFRNGAIAASIWKRLSSTGFEYLDFSLSRSWKLKTGEKEGYSQNFFERNEEALIDVVEQASEYIRAHQLSTVPSEPSSSVIYGNTVQA